MIIMNDQRNKYAVEKGSTPAFTIALRRGTIFISLLAGIAVSLIVCLIAGSVRSVKPLPVQEGSTASKPSRPGSVTAAGLQKSIAEQTKKLAVLIPSEPYLIISTADNTFVIMQDTTVLRKGTCSTGSYVLLKTTDKREWTFKTPRGMFRIQSKKESPVWHQPDWAFIEEGRKIPAANSPERYVSGVLGDYALTLGHGYMIHGTLYQRYLGLPVTHGCVRLGDADLKAVYEALHVGSKVFIY